MGTGVALGAVLSMSQKPAWSIAGLVAGTLGVTIGYHDTQKSADIQAAQEMRSRRRPS